MDAQAEQPFTPGTACVFTTIEGGFPAIRHVEFLSLLNGGTQAQVKWGQQTFNVPLDQLSHQQPPQPPAFLGKWFTTPTPPIPATSEQLDERLGTARAALAKAHERVRDVQTAVDAARAIVDRAAKELNTAQAALRSFDQHARSEQIAFEESLRLGRPTQPASNGHDTRHYVQNRTDQASHALTKFQSELANQMQHLGESLSQVRKAASDVVSLLLQQAVESLRAQEIQAAIVRAELLAVANHWFAGAELGPLKLPPVTGNYLEVMPAWETQVAVRTGGSDARTRPWKDVYSRLLDDPEANFRFALEE